MTDDDGNWEQVDGASCRPEPQANPALETQAMSEIDVALDPLDHAARVRVLGWAAERFCVPLAEMEAWDD